jgi:hypothetical protein
LLIYTVGIKIEKTVVSKRAKDHWFSVFALGSYYGYCFNGQKSPMVFSFSVSGSYLIFLIEVVRWIVIAVDRVVYGKCDVTSSNEEK